MGTNQARRPHATLSAMAAVAALAGALLAPPARADDAADCAKGDGKLLVGKVAAKPKFVHGKFLKGVELSHTHISLVSDADGKTYDVAIDNVFANGYKKNAKAVPAPLNAIKPGDRIAACGQPFDGGIHWVHTNCGDTPTTAHPDGWLRHYQADGSLGPNMESNQAYCPLWGGSH